jgi:hypothetical protein
MSKNSRALAKMMHMEGRLRNRKDAPPDDGSPDIEVDVAAGDRARSFKGRQYFTLSVPRDVYATLKYRRLMEARHVGDILRELLGITK